MDFRGRVAIVTGAAGALGSVVARRLSDEGAVVAAPVSSHRSPLVAVALGLPKGRFFSSAADLRKKSAVEAFSREVEDKFGRIDILVNAAGGYAGGTRIEKVTSDDMSEMYQMNFLSALHACQAVIPLMKDRGYGRIVSIAARPALLPTRQTGPYAISKRAVITLTETIAAELKGTGVTANAIAPGIIDTEANRASMPDADYGSWVGKEELAFLILVLCSEELRSVSGNVVRAFGAL